MKTEIEWIPIYRWVIPHPEPMGKGGKYVLVAYRDGFIDVLATDLLEEQEITHWAKLPKHPKELESEDEFGPVTPEELEAAK